MVPKRTLQDDHGRDPSTKIQPRQGTFTAALKLVILVEYESYERGLPRCGEPLHCLDICLRLQGAA